MVFSGYSGFIHLIRAISHVCVFTFVCVKRSNQVKGIQSQINIHHYFYICYLMNFLFYVHIYILIQQVHRPPYSLNKSGIHKGKQEGLSQFFCLQNAKEVDLVKRATS